LKLNSGVRISIVAAALVAATMACGSGDTSTPTAQPTLAGEQKLPSLGTVHIANGTTHSAYNSKPATSGPHYAGWAQWGVHDEVLPDEVLVHNLEHGGGGIHYNCPDSCPTVVTALDQFAIDYDKVIVSPYPGMEKRFALTAWTYIDSFDDYDAARIEAFIKKHMNSPEAPEPLVR